jgi:hypothetical protein
MEIMTLRVRSVLPATGIVRDPDKSRTRLAREHRRAESTDRTFVRGAPFGDRRDGCAGKASFGAPSRKAAGDQTAAARPDGVTAGSTASRHPARAPGPGSGDP